MNRTFDDMKTSVGQNIGDTSSATAVVIGSKLNDAYFDILKRANIEIINSDYNIDTSSRDNVLPYSFKSAIRVYDSTNSQRLMFTSQKEMVDDYVSEINQTGGACKYTIFERGYQAQPTSSSALSLYSSSASDVDINVRVTGISDGVEMSETVALDASDGTTPVASTNAYTSILKISKQETVGKVSITANSGAVTVAVIAPFMQDYKVKILRLYDTPASTINLVIPHYVQPPPMSSAYDTPIIDASEAIVLGAEYRMWRRKRQFGKARDIKVEYEQAISHYIWSQENHPDEVKVFNIQPYTREIY